MNYVVLMILGCLVFEVGAGQHKDLFITYTEDVVNGVSFAHRVDVADGVVKEKWTIGGRLATEEEYEEAFAEAEKVERKMERKALSEGRKKKDRERAESQRFAQQSKVAIEKKRLSLVVQDIEGETARILDERLKPFYAFHASTFESHDRLSELINVSLAEAKRLIAQSDDQPLEPLSTLIGQLEDTPSKLRTFFRATVSNAINKCDDTKLLKDLLEVVS